MNAVIDFLLIVLAVPTIAVAISFVLVILIVPKVVLALDLLIRGGAIDLLQLFF